MEKEHESLKHLFQQEFSKMVAVISKLFGLQHIEIAEDIVSETFLLATKTWGNEAPRRKRRGIKWCIVYCKRRKRRGIEPEQD